MMRVLRLRHDKKRRLTVGPLFALLSICLSVVWLWNNAALCVASTSASSGSMSGSAAGTLACRCLKCSMPGGKCCCAKKTIGQNPVCLRALCDTEEAALARAVWLPPTLPVARLVVCPPFVAPVTHAPARQPERLTARSVAPLSPPPRRFSLVKKNRHFLIS